MDCSSTIVKNILYVQLLQITTYTYIHFNFTTKQQTQGASKPQAKAERL